jgi:hypothetical protein
VTIRVASVLCAIGVLASVAGANHGIVPPASTTPSSQDAHQGWQRTLQLTGAIAGIGRQTELASTGQLKVTDRRRGTQLITQASATELAPIAPTHATANVTIAATAPLGIGAVTPGNELVGAASAFTLTPPPLLTLVVPNNGQPEAALRVAVKGQFTHFVPGLTTANLGAGITVNSTTVTDGTHATVNLTIAGGAGLGARNVVLTTGAETVTLPNGFTVTAVPTDTPAFAYAVYRPQTEFGATQIVSVIDTAANVVIATIPAGLGCW